MFLDLIGCQKMDHEISWRVWLYLRLEGFEVVDAISWCQKNITPQYSFEVVKRIIFRSINTSYSEWVPLIERGMSNEEIADLIYGVNIKVHQFREVVKAIKRHRKVKT